MPFDHDAKVSGDCARFADLPGGRLAMATCMPDEGARRESGGHGTTVLVSGGRAALAHRRVPRVPAPRWSTAPDSNLVAAGLLADARPACGRQAGPFGRCGLADRRPVPAVCRRTRPGHGRPNALFCTNFARHIRRRVGQLDVLAEAGPTCPGRLRTRCARADAQARRLPLPAGMLALTSAAICPGGRSASVFLPDAPRLTVVPWRERYLPLFSRANPGTTRPPGPSAKITQGARPCDRNPPCNLTR
jgi:hypothetical protein